MSLQASHMDVCLVDMDSSQPKCRQPKAKSPRDETHRTTNYLHRMPPPKNISNTPRLIVAMLTPQTNLLGPIESTTTVATPN